ncbi:sodium:solute symporter family protein [Staphylococcus sciuri]|uniref:sodium:solute symporter family protein n=1 Tax=Mammaliicoccus sciuri TaxID=1296 RepID=UPI0013E94935|nr:sodium:solute symporter family protein [Mammaliicoccus sciuri]MCJ0908042.1 sodium:solute symporter family protein [Mammaliicoccus sciuri]MCJ0922990.1 sodium:solute symporter family protein [Mammaliicoccus sciuri]MDO0952291.1 sodium:solute symporter family protein [Mammaliicoccus sciuri]MEB6119453.1 sodium:solute symporter family protein [Mammaliicoccus sciuri]NGX75312.1 sodium:solute symporter family protein [Mammaliicoccus sciuri]
MLIALVITLAVVLSGLFIFSLIMGKRHQSIDDWNVGGRSLPIYVQIGTQFATVMGGAVIVGLVGTAYTYGWASLTYGLLTAIGFLPYIFMAKWLRNSDFESLPDALRAIFGKNKVFMILVIIATLIVPFGWMITQLVGFGKIFSEITGFEPSTVVIIFALISLAFVLPAGMTTVAWTDFIFGCFMIVGAIIAVVVALQMGGSWTEIASNHEPKYTELPKGLFGIGGTMIIFWIFGVMPGNLTNQQIFQRIYAADNAKNAKISIIATAVLFALATAWSSVMGITINHLNPGMSNPEDATGWFLTQTPAWFTVVFSTFIVATIMSTLSSAIQSVVVTLTKDIYVNYVNPNTTRSQQVKVSRIIAVSVLIIAVSLSILVPQALGWIVASFAYSVSALIVPVIFGFIFKDTKWINTYGGISSIIGGIVGSAVAHSIGTALPYVFYGICLSIICLFAVSYLTKEKTGVIENDI